MSDYQKEQSEAFTLVLQHFQRISPAQLGALKQEVDAYLAFREAVDRYLLKYFDAICTNKCYQNRMSACCSREGIITFFADVVINALVSKQYEIEHLITILGRTNQGFKCIYLGDAGCRWRIKPIVCEMYLCETATHRVFDQNPYARKEWERLKTREKTFTWPDRPVLFDLLEQIFIDGGYFSPLMYMHNSPGLLRVKKRKAKSEKKGGGLDEVAG